MDYYMGVPDEEVLPSLDASEVVEANKDRESMDPFLAKEDLDLIEETLSMGMDQLMTFDKALITMFPRLKEYIEKNNS